MLERGFEWSLQNGEPLNAPPKRYRWHAPCCKLAVADRVVTCGHPWNVSAAVPVGNPVQGTAWDKAYPDPGVYVGGEVF